jgi:hypothetical protein
MKKRMVIGLTIALATNILAHAGENDEGATIERQGKIMRCLGTLIPMTVTNQTPYLAALTRVVAGVEGKDWSQTKGSLSAVPSSALDAATLLKTSLRLWTFLATEYRGYYILSDVNIGSAAEALPVNSEDELKVALTRVVLGNPESFMSGFIIPKGSQKWMKYDFAKTYTLTPTGVKIEKTKLAEPKPDGAGLKPAP